MMFYFLIDATRVWTNGTPFHYAGTNAILLYVGHLILSQYFPFYFEVTPTHGHLLARVSFACSLWLVIAIYFFRKRIFIVL
jgi:heparan-alpha-glucosaminide N-acetyltransferase